MPIPRNWSEELISEWLHLLGYLAEVGVPVGVGSGGGRKEADVVGAKIKDNGKKGRILQIYHVEVGTLSGAHEEKVDILRTKFSRERTQEIVKRLKRRMGSIDEVEYQNLYVDIWPTEIKVAKLMNRKEIKQEEIKVWTPKTLFQEVFQAMKDWVPTHKSKSGEATLLECWWMLKLLEKLREWGMLNIDESTNG
ncbi:MAG: hypothetical protein MUO40_00380 [Anaerolineaceae bacterium]|nr:hypothetical protein [Anaerolineaceae bacterium]